MHKAGLLRQWLQGGEPEDQPDLEQRQLNPTDRELNDGIPCRMDPMVAPLAHMFCESSDLEVLKANCDLNPFYTVNLQSLCNYYRFDYARRSVDTIATLVNDVLFTYFKGWYAYELQPGVASYFYPHTTLLLSADALFPESSLHCPHGCKGHRRGGHEIPRASRIAPPLLRPPAQAAGPLPHILQGVRRTEQYDKQDGVFCASDYADALSKCPLRPLATPTSNLCKPGIRTRPAYPVPYTGMFRTNPNKVVELRILGDNATYNPLTSPSACRWTTRGLQAPPLPLRCGPLRQEDHGPRR
ncbi:hypothetical protein GUITHDRAFT_115752 [Guillardia theta CCMP2712]|uniref:Uncharacterized protein n=1 Tax=Guillardia theta (strain CCMP2712) TaxID=905079 RepID=L1IQ90_GUITC|nr:hypothetical protein GUITHDRAFT_115752 [Guillardia theta CCMP2712]EKX37990.1 hypothetical protein GUITHDRAFT_115752 [Guillardia theta CCMP2712]|eukprot:XP_005824970.1 hypothetical protein GUITHDRAFT_115752 [Guillardia theta CCMP2712]